MMSEESMYSVFLCSIGTVWDSSPDRSATRVPDGWEDESIIG